MSGVNSKGKCTAHVIVDDSLKRCHIKVEHTPVGGSVMPTCAVGLSGARETFWPIALSDVISDSTDHTGKWSWVHQVTVHLPLSNYHQTTAASFTNGRQMKNIHRLRQGLLPEKHSVPRTLEQRSECHWWRVKPEADTRGNDVAPTADDQTAHYRESRHTTWRSCMTRCIRLLTTIKLKLALLAFNARNNNAPLYLSCLLHNYVPGRRLPIWSSGRVCER